MPYYYLDADNVYVYAKTDVLRNKLQIKDAQKLEEAEHLLVSTRLAELYKNPIKIKSVKDICAIHKYLFQDIYSWAGTFRSVNISKEGRPFLAFQSFPKASEYINELIKNVRNADSRERMITSFAELLDHLNHMHPFREGNGRTQREVIRSLLLEKKITADLSSLEDETIYTMYMQGTRESDTPLLKKLFATIIAGD